MNAGGIVAIVPMKPLRLAKVRLAGVLSPSQRAALSLGMLDAVIRAALGALADEVWVTGGDATVKRLTVGLGVQWFEEGGSGLNGAMTHAIARAFDAGHSALYLPADLPLVTAEDVGELIRASEDGIRLTLSPAHRDGGTNAILVPYRCPFRPLLGIGSFQRHREQVSALGLPFAICDRPGLGLDLDTPADLNACEDMQPGILSRLLGMGEKRPVSG